MSGPIELQAGQTLTAPNVILQPSADVTARAEGSADWMSGTPSLYVVAAPFLGGSWWPRAYVEAPLNSSGDVQLRLPIRALWRFELHLRTQGRNEVLDRVTHDIRNVTDAIVTFNLTRVRYRGRVIGEAEDLSGSIWLRAVQGASEVYRAPVLSSGEFAVNLREGGQYIAHYSSETGSITDARVLADFMSPSIEAPVRLPDERLAGTVIGPSGERLPGVTVVARPANLDDETDLRRAPTSVVTDESGGFLFRWMNAGPWEVRAMRPPLAAEPQTVLLDGTSSHDVILVMKDNATFQGKIVDARQRSVPLARGLAFVEPEAGQIPSPMQFVADADGAFEVQFDRPLSRPVQVVVAAPGRPLTTFRIDARVRSGAVNLMMSDRGGEVRLLFSRSGQTQTGLPENWNLFALRSEKGVVVHMSTLHLLGTSTLISDSSDVVLTLRSVSPGQWQILQFNDVRESQLFVAGVASAIEVGRVTVFPGAAASVDLRNSPK
ncbi:MAG TPA: carboxypeptidase-like regulatory domain-containing protein [Vicinamibacterales bacterium]